MVRRKGRWRRKGCVFFTRAGKARQALMVVRAASRGSAARGTRYRGKGRRKGLLGRAEASVDHGRRRGFALRQTGRSLLYVSGKSVWNKPFQ